MFKRNRRPSDACVGKPTVIGSDNGLLPSRRQTIIWTNAGILLIGPLGTNFGEIWIEINIFIQENAFENVVCETAAIFCLGLDVLIFTHTDILSDRLQSCTCSDTITRYISLL